MYQYIFILILKIYHTFTGPDSELFQMIKIEKSLWLVVRMLKFLNLNLNSPSNWTIAHLCWRYWENFDFFLQKKESNI